MPESGAASVTGWRVVGALFLILTLGSGFGFYNLSVYMNALAEQRGFPIAQLSFAITLFFLVGGFAGLWVARLLERYDIRMIMTAGALVSGLALALAGFARNLFELYCLYALFGLGNSGVGLIPATTLVARWFPGANRSMALATASTGLSLGGVLITPLCVWVIASIGIGEALGWFGVVYTLALLPLIWGLIREPVAVQSSGAVAPGAAVTGWAERDAIRSRFFRLLIVAYFLLLGSQVGGINHLFNHAVLLTDRTTGAIAVQVLGVASISGRFFGGWVVRWTGLRMWALVNTLGQGLGLSVLAVAQDSWAIWLGAGLFGLTVGNLLMLLPLILVEAFGIRSYARIYATGNALTTLGVGGGPFLLGVLFTVGGYAFAYGITAALAGVALGILWLAGPLPRESQGPGS